MLELLRLMLELRQLMLEPHQLMFIQGLLDLALALALALAPVIGAVARGIIQTPVMHVPMHRGMNWTLILTLMSMTQMNIEITQPVLYSCHYTLFYRESGTKSAHGVWETNKSVPHPRRHRNTDSYLRIVRAGKSQSRARNQK